MAVGLLGLLAILQLARGSRAAGLSKEKLTELAVKAVNEDPAIANPAIEELRAAGPEGLEALKNANAPAIAFHTNSKAGPVDVSWSRVSAALDAVAGQRDDYASGLYWYTDLSAAEAAAKASGKPILSLRLLGNLTDEFSCANSRFFRTVLYANSGVSKELQEKFILHWQSVRPVPVVTIDFGDGRKIRRTVAGNSVHYVLMADGRVVDGIPGLYGPKAFLNELAEARQAVTNIANQPLTQQAALLRHWHDDQTTRISKAFAADQAQAKVVPLSVPFSTPDELSDSDWEKIASLHAADGELDRHSKEFMAAKTPTATDAGRLAFSKMIVESPLVRMTRNFQRSIAQDTVRNQYTFHLTIHCWLANPTLANDCADVDLLNQRVYAKLFLTPQSDPWLGLVPADTYTALDNEGLPSH